MQDVLNQKECNNVVRDESSREGGKHWVQCDMNVNAHDTWSWFVVVMN